MKGHFVDLHTANGLLTHKGGLLISRSGMRRRGLPVALISGLFVLVLLLAVGAGTASAATEGPSNNFFGTGAGSNNSGNNYNSFFGAYAGYSNNYGTYNTFSGYYAGYNNNNGNYNTFSGYGAGNYNTIGSYNTFSGAVAGYHNTVESSNTFVGHYADLDPGSDPNNLVTNATAIGARSYVSSSNSLVLGSIKGFNGATASVNVGIGTPAPARQLHIKGDDAVFRMDRSQNTAAFMLVRIDPSGNPLKTFVVGTNANGSNDGEFVINDLGTAVGGSGVRRMTIKNNGDVEFTGKVTAQNFYTPSSLAYKTNVRTYENALETVMQLRGVRFDWKKSGRPSVGLIAEEVEGVVPEVVSHAGDSDAVTGVDYAGLVGVLVEAIKEQQAQAEAQQAKLEAVKAEYQAKLEAQQAEIEGLKAKALQAESQQAKPDAVKAEYKAKLESQQAEIARLRAEMQQQQEAISRLMVQFSLMKGPEMISQR